MLKRWAVSHLASALADYLEGVTPESVHGSLGTERGDLNLRARVNPAALRPFGLEILASEVNLEVRIPWRHLKSQPTEFTVQTVRLEVRPCQPSDAKGRSVDIEEVRAKKEEAVARLMRQAENGGAPVAEPGMVASASHAILRQLQVSMASVSVLVERENSRDEPLELVLESARLVSLGPDWSSPPEPNQTDLCKVLDFRGFYIREGKSEEPLVGPLALELRLLHSTPRQLLELRASTSGTVAVRIDPRTAGSVSRLVSRIGRDRGESQGERPRRKASRMGVGQEYSKLYLQHLRRDSYDIALLQEIEDGASAEWIVAWRRHCQKVLGEAQASGAGHRRQTYWQWITGADAAGNPNSGQAAKDETDDLGVLLTEAFEGGQLPSVQLPTGMDLTISVSQVKVILFSQDMPLEVLLRGAKCSVAAYATVPSVCQTVAHLWEVAARLDLTSLSCCLDGHPLIQLLEQADPEYSQRPSKGTLSCDWFNSFRKSGSAVHLEIVGSQRDVPVPGKPPLQLAVSLSEEPIRIFLEAQRAHSLLISVLALVKAIEEGMGHSSAERSLPLDSLPSMPGEDTPKADSAMSAVLDADQTTVELNVDFEAPILQLELPQEGTLLLARLGGLHVHTCGAAAWNGKGMPPEETVSLQSPACFCQLKDTSMVVVKDGVEHWVYEPSTVSLHCTLDPGEGLLLQAEAATMRCSCTPELISMLGLAKASFDYALAPLAGFMADPALESEEQQAQATQGVASSASPAAESAGGRMRLELAVGLCELSFVPDQGPFAVVACFGRSEALVNRQGTELTARACLKSAAFTSGGMPVIRCDEALNVTCTNTDVELRVGVSAPPVTVRWDRQAVKEGLSTISRTADYFMQGTKLGRMALPLSSEEVVSQMVYKRAEQLGEDARAFVQAELQYVGLGPAQGPLDQAPARAEAAAPAFVRHLTLSCTRVSLTVEPRKLGPHVQEVQAIALDLQTTLQLLPGKAELKLAVAGLDLDIGPRRILTPRPADVELLRFGFCTSQGCAPSAQLSWAQVVLVYRQRDVNMLTAIVQQDMVGAFTDEGSYAEPLDPHESSPVGAQNGKTPATDSSLSLKYELSIAAPLVFVPTDSGRTSAGPRQSGGPEAAVLPSREHLDSLSLKDGSLCFQPVPGDGFLVIDFGNLRVCQGDSKTAVGLQLREMQVLSAQGDSKPWFVQSALLGHRMLHPLGVDIQVALDGSVDAQLLSPVAAQEAALQLSLTRPQMTLILDVVWFNVNCQQAREEPAELPVMRQLSRMSTLSRRMERASSVSSQVKAASPPHVVLVTWRSPLRLDVAFTDSAPLASLELIGGTIRVESSISEIVTDIQCQSLLVRDGRLDTRNTGKKLLECSQDNPDIPSVRVVCHIPNDCSEASLVEVCVQQPVLFMLPQLLLDLGTWGLSGWQQSAQAKAGAAMPHYDHSELENLCTMGTQTIQVRINGATLRLLARWDLPQEGFEVVSEIFVSILQDDCRTQIKEVRLSGTKFCRFTPLGSLGQLCPRFGFLASASYTISEDQQKGHRSSTLICESIRLDPMRVRLSVTDCNVLISAASDLAQLDADSAEPAEELRKRDPLASSLQQRFYMRGGVELNGLTLHILDDLGRQGAHRQALRLELNCPLVQLEIQTTVGEPGETSVRIEHLQVKVDSYNERVSQWEPVLAPSVWLISYKTWLQRDMLHPEVKDYTKSILEASPAKNIPLNVVVTVPFVQLASRLLPALGSSTEESPSLGQTPYEDILLGLNLSGLECLACRWGEACESTKLRPSGEPVPLGHLLQRWNPPPPPMTIKLPGLPGAPEQKISLEKESCTSWRTPAGLLLLQVLMPRPPQRLVLISSAMTVTNQTPMNVEVRFLASKNGQPLPAGMVQPCAEASCLNATLQQEAEVKAEREQLYRSLAQREVLPEVPVTARPLKGRLRVEVLRATGLVRAEIRAHSMIKVFIGRRPPDAYVEATLSSDSAVEKTQVVTAVQGTADFGRVLYFPLPDGTTLNTLSVREVKLRVLDSIGMQATARGDPHIGSATMQLGLLDMSGSPKNMNLELVREGKARGHVEVRVSLEAFENAIQTHSFLLSAQQFIPELSSASSADTGSGGGARQGAPAGAGSASPSREGPGAGIHRVRPGGVIMAGLEVMASGSPWLQVRPAAAEGQSYGWGDATSLDDLAQGRILCSKSAGSSPGPSRKYLHLSTVRKGDWCDVHIEAPLRIANACPCEVHATFGSVSRQAEHSGDEKSECKATEPLMVFDGYGGFLEVPPDSGAELFLQLDQDECFHWSAEGQTSTLRPSCPGTNFLRVLRQAHRVRWRFYRLESFSQTEAFSRKSRIGDPFLIPAQQEVPIFDLSPEDLAVSFALCEQYTASLTTWSAPWPVRPPPTVCQRVPVELFWQGECMVLGLTKQQGRRIVVAARNWFVDSTGLGVGISHGLQAWRLPLFGHNIALPADLKGENPEIYLSLPGQNALAITGPVLGGSTKAWLSPSQPCVLKVEPIAVACTFGVLCKLLSLVPGMMAFNQLKDCEVGFRQHGCQEVVWLPPGGSVPFYVGSAGSPALVEVAVRPLGPESAAPVFSEPLGISERHVGAFPRALPMGGERRLVCVQVDEASDIVTITASGAEQCHQLVNKHPCLWLHAYFEGEEKNESAHSHVGYNECMALACSGAPGCKPTDSLWLELIDARGGTTGVRTVVNLTRMGVVVPKTAPKAKIRISFRGRVAEVVVTRVESTGEEFADELQLKLHVPQLCVSLISEQPRTVAFAVTLEELRVSWLKSITSLRQFVLDLQWLQVDLHSLECSDVVIGSAKETPLLHWESVREDLCAQDMLLRLVRLQLAALEVTVCDALISEGKRFAEAAVPKQMGLSLEDVFSRAGIPYNVSCGSPPEPSQKYILRDISVSQIKVYAFCRVNPSILPDMLTSMVTVLSGFASTILVDGAVVKFPEQHLFKDGNRFEGSLSSLIGQVLGRYKKVYVKALLSLLHNSNLILGGVLTRQFWHPKHRKVNKPCPLQISVKSDVVRLPGDDPLRQVSLGSRDDSASGASSNVNQFTVARMSSSGSCCKCMTSTPQASLPDRV